MASKLDPKLEQLKSGRYEPLERWAVRVLDSRAKDKLDAVLKGAV